MSTDMRVGIGYDVHQFAVGRPLVLGGVRLEHPRGLAGHSDADVLLHAIADALLGSSAAVEEMFAMALATPGIDAIDKSIRTA